MTAAVAIALLPQVLKIVELGMAIELERIQHMDETQKRDYWNRREKIDAFWFGLLEKITTALDVHD